MNRIPQEWLDFLREQYPAFTWKAGQLVTPRTAGAWAQSALGR